jgi:hypothetical protein
MHAGGTLTDAKRAIELEPRSHTTSCFLQPEKLRCFPLYKGLVIARARSLHTIHVSCTAAQHQCSAVLYMGDANIAFGFVGIYLYRYHI